MSNGTKKYDYTREAQNLYRRSTKTKPIITDESGALKQHTLAVRKQEVDLEKENLEERKERAAIAEGVLGSIGSAKKLATTMNKLKWETELKPLTTGYNKLVYDDYSDTQSIFQRVGGFLRKGASGGEDILGSRLELTPDFLDYLDDIGNYSKFMESEQGQDIINRMVSDPSSFDRLPEFTNKQWKDLEKHGGDSSGWQEYMKQESIENPIWNDSEILKVIENKDLSYSPITLPENAPVEEDYNIFEENDIIDTEVTQMLDTFDYWWDDDSWSDGGTV